MDPEKSSLDPELSQSLLEGLLSAVSAATSLQYARDIFTYLHRLQTEVHLASREKATIEGSNKNSQLQVAAEKVEKNYSLIMLTIRLLRECMGPACSRSRNAQERVKRLIARARKFLNEVREGLFEIENLGEE